MREKINQFKQWLAQLNSRERRLVIGVGIFLLIFLPYQLIWVPFDTAFTDIEKKVQIQQKNLLAMQQMANEIRQLRRGGGSSSNQPLLGLIETTARRRKLGGALTKLQPDGEQKARIQFEDVAFDEVVTWLDGLITKQGIVVNEIFVERKDGVGKVNVRLVVERA